MNEPRCLCRIGFWSGQSGEAHAIRLLVASSTAACCFLLAAGLRVTLNNRLLLIRWKGVRHSYTGLMAKKLLRQKAPGVHQQVSELALSVVAGLASGQSVLQSLYQCVVYMEAPVKGAISRALKRYETGMSFAEALQMAGLELKSKDFDQFLRVVLLFERLGSDPRAALCCVAESAQERAQTRALLVAKLSEVRLSALIVSALPLLLGVATFIAQPDVVRFALESSVGRVAYLTGLCSWAAGTSLVWRLSNPSWI